MNKFLLSIIALFLFVGCAIKEPQMMVTKATPYSAIFTTELDENEDPTDNIKEISLKEKRVYFYVKWYLPINRERTHTIKIFDGSGKKVYSYNYHFTPTTTRWNTWTWYDFKKGDRVGKWKFQIFYKGKLLLEKYLKVTE